MLLIDTIQALSLKDKRALVKTDRSIIADEVLTTKRVKVLSKVAKDNAKKEKVLAQIKAAEEKLAKLTAKLSA